VDVERSGVIPCVLFRVYGRDVGALYDSDTELNIFRTLSHYHIAPRMYANGPGWRIEEWHFAVALKTRYMTNPSILTQVASQLGRLHKLGSRHDFPRDILALPPASLDRLSSWVDNCQEAAEKLIEGGDSETSRRLADLNVEEVVKERDWLRKFALAEDPHVKGSGLDVVFSHNDVQPNNILQTHYGLRFIDFEYSSMDFAAYDIANYFNECLYDYIHDKYPFYTQNLSDYPTDWEQRLFCSTYLSEFMESKIPPSDAAVTTLLKRVKKFSLVSHYLWTVWSVIRAPQACTFNEFDFLAYAQARYDCYKREKLILLSGEAADPVPEKPASTSRPERSVRSESWYESRLRKTPFVVGGALTASGILLGAGAVVALLKVLKKR